MITKFDWRGRYSGLEKVKYERVDGMIPEWVAKALQTDEKTLILTTWRDLITSYDDHQLDPANITLLNHIMSKIKFEHIWTRQ